MHEGEHYFHNLEAPAAGTTLASPTQRLRGWLVPKRGHHFVDVRARVGTRVFPGVYGFPRADLAAHFEPSRPWLPAEYTIDVEFAAPAVSAIIEALDLAGGWQTIFSAEFGLASAGASTVPPPPEMLTADEFGLALERCLKTPTPGDHAAEIVASLPHPRVLRPHHPPFYGHLVEPAAIANALYGRLHVLGWLFHETQAIRRVFVSTDLLAFQPLQHSGPFARVADRFPNLPAAAECRLFGFAELSSQLPSPASVRLFAELADGSTHLCLAVQSRPVTTEESKAAFPPFSIRRFDRERRALQTALVARKIPVERGRTYFAQLWRRASEYRRAAAPVRADRPHATAQRSPAREASRLLLITHNLNYEGAPLLFVEYARHLATVHGSKLTVLSAQEGPLRDAFERVGARVEVVDVTPLLTAKSANGRREKIASLARQFSGSDLDLVVANTLSSFWGVELARALGRPSLLYIHESTNPAVFFKDQPRAVLSAVYDAFHDATAVSFNTAATRAYYEHLGSGANFHLTPAWIDLAAIDAFRARHSRESLRPRLELAPADLLVVNVGTVCDRKGQHDFVRAIEYLWRTHPDLAARARFRMIGGRDTPYNRFLRDTLVMLGRPGIELVAETGGAYDYFGAADLFVCTSYEESFPRVVLEAMAFEVPIVSTNVHGIPYMLRAPDDALLVNPGDTHQLAAALAEALQDASAARARSARARERVKTFDAAAVLPRHAALTFATAGAFRS
jgi:glycosyltransferase involved in cell wall biosynthesis